MRKERAQELLRLAINATKRTLPMDLKIEELKQKPFGVRADFVITLPAGNKKITHIAEIRETIQKPVREMLIMQKQRLPRLMLVTRYVNPIQADDLRNDGIEFLDTAGNVYLNLPGTFVFVKGNKPLDFHGRRGLAKGFPPTALKIIYAFLCNAELVTRAYREIADAVGVALGTVGWVMRDLREKGHLAQNGDVPVLTAKPELLNQWTTDYIQRLRPKVFLGTFKAPPNWWEQVKLDPDKAQWGGEVAARKLTKHLKPEIATIYVAPDAFDQLLIQHRLKKDIDGNTNVLEKFWKAPEVHGDETIVHPILVYADLIATGNQRNLETAQILYDRKIVEFIREG